MASPTLLFLLLLLSPAAAVQVCVVGAGMGGAAVTHFLTHYSPNSTHSILVFDRNPLPGGRMATVTLSGDRFEAGGTIIHPNNLHAVRFASLLGLRRSPKPDPDYSSWVGIWDGKGFVFETFPVPTKSSSAVYRWFYEIMDAARLFWRYGVSLVRMNNFVKDMLGKFLLYYVDVESRPVFETAEEMLRWTGLYSLTQRTLREELTDVDVNPLLISELITVITRVNYGQDVNISGLAGAVSLAGSNEGLWKVEGGNWQLAAGLLKLSNATLHLSEEIDTISYDGGYYQLSSTQGNNYSCDVAVIATPLDELNISFTPSFSIPNRKLQHTYTTFVRGLLKPAYFGLNSISEIPGLIGTLEVPEIPFSSISILKKYSEEDMAYKVFSRSPMKDVLLDTIFSTRNETIQINWAAYPHYTAPETFAPFVLDGNHLYYINSFESAASAIEVSAVSAENIARLILSRLNTAPNIASTVKDITDDYRHMDF